jgi:hypothetical protein
MWIVIKDEIGGSTGDGASCCGGEHSAAFARFKIVGTRRWSALPEKENNLASSIINGPTLCWNKE